MWNLNHVLLEGDDKKTSQTKLADERMYWMLQTTLTIPGINEWVIDNNGISMVHELWLSASDDEQGLSSCSSAFCQVIYVPEPSRNLQCRMVAQQAHLSQQLLPLSELPATPSFQPWLLASSSLLRPSRLHPHLSR